MSLNCPNSSISVDNISTMANNFNQNLTNPNSVSQSQSIYSLTSNQVIPNSTDNHLKTLIFQQPTSFSSSVKTFSPEMYQLTFPAILNEDSDSDDDDIDEDEMFPSSPSKMDTCDSSQANFNFPAQSKPADTADTYIIFDPKKSTNGQVKSSRQLLMTQFFPGKNAIITHKPDTCCNIM